MCRQAGFFSGGQTALLFVLSLLQSPSLRSHLRNMLATIYSSCFTITETRLCVELHAGTLLRHDVVLQTDAVAVGKCGPNQRLSECPTEDGCRSSTAALSSLHMFALVRNTLLVQLLTLTT